MENYKEKICDDFNNQKIGSCNPFIINWDDPETDDEWDEDDINDCAGDYGLTHKE